MNYANIVSSVRVLIYISVACTLISVIVAKTKFIGSVKYICGIAVLFSLITVFSPLFKCMGTLINIDFPEDNVTEGEESSDELIINQSASYICEYVKGLISQKYSIEKDNISVSVTLDTSDKENITVKNITVRFIGQDEALYPEISEYISNTMGCNVIILSK